MPGRRYAELIRAPDRGVCVCEVNVQKRRTETGDVFFASGEGGVLIAWDTLNPLARTFWLRLVLLIPCFPRAGRLFWEDCSTSRVRLGLSELVPFDGTDRLAGGGCKNNHKPHNVCLCFGVDCMNGWQFSSWGSTGWSSGVVLGRKVTTRRFWYKGYWKI